jgi:hypothetical protein
MVMLYDVEFNGKKWVGSYRPKTKEVYHAIFECKRQIELLKAYKPAYSNFKLYDRLNIVGREPQLLWSQVE